MTRWKPIMFAATLVLCACGAVISQAGYEGYRGGDCSGSILQKWGDADINRVQVRNGHAFSSGPYTTIAVTTLRTDHIPGPTISGHYAEDIAAALQNLADQSYYTVDVTVYESGGWQIMGKRNREKERQESERRSRQAESKSRKEESDGSKWTYIGEAGGTIISRNCEIRLFSSIHDDSNRLSSPIEVSDEYLNVVWGTTEVNVGMEYKVELYLEDRSGKKRLLRPGENWIDPGRYRVFLTFYGIRSTEVTLKYKCK